MSRRPRNDLTRRKQAGRLLFEALAGLVPSGTEVGTVVATALLPSCPDFAPVALWLRREVEQKQGCRGDPLATIGAGGKA